MLFSKKVKLLTNNSAHKHSELFLPLHYIAKKKKNLKSINKRALVLKENDPYVPSLISTRSMRASEKATKTSDRGLNIGG
jgi:hypothetical protein